MTYATQTDLENAKGLDALIELTDRDQKAVDSDKIDRALVDASAEIDMYLGGLYAIPLSTVPDVIRHFSINMSYYFLYGDRDASEQDRQRYDDAIAALKDIRDGKTSLDLPPAIVDLGDVSAGTVEASDRLYGRESLKGF